MTNTVDAVWKRVDKRSPDECWPWTGYTSNGRGRLDIGNEKGVYAPRAAYLSSNPGTIDLHDDGTREQCVCHHCDNPICCNPAHLFIGSHAENMADKKRKGRVSRSRHRAKLTPEDVIHMRQQKKAGATKKALALLYEVSEATVSGALYGRYYLDVA